MDNERLISAIYKRRPLWDRHSKNYNNRDTTRRLWAEVSSIMGLITPDIKKKWGNLRDQFRKEYIRLNKLAGYAVDYNTKGKSSWAYYDTLLFLSNQINLQANMPPKNIEYNKNFTSDESTLPASVFATEYIPSIMPQSVDASPVSPQPQPSPSPYFEPTYMSEFCVPPAESNRLGERPLDMDEEYLELQRRKLQLIESRSEELYAYDPDRNFLMSLLPYLKEIPRRRKILVQQKLLQVFNEEDNRAASVRCQDLDSDYRHPCESTYTSEETDRAEADRTSSNSQNPSKTLNETSIDIKQSPSSPEHRDGYEAFGTFIASELRALGNDIPLVTTIKKTVQFLIMDSQEKQAGTKKRIISTSTCTVPRPVKIKTEYPDDDADQ